MTYGRKPRRDADVCTAVVKGQANERDGKAA